MLENVRVCNKIKKVYYMCFLSEDKRERKRERKRKPESRNKTSIITLRGEIFINFLFYVTIIIEPLHVVLQS